MVVLGCVVLICFVELSFIFAIYILLLKKSSCVVFLECSVPSCDIWSQYDRPCLGITRHNAFSQMAKIYRVIEIKSNQLVQENVLMITDLATKRI